MEFDQIQLKFIEDTNANTAKEVELSKQAVGQLVVTGEQVNAVYDNQERLNQQQVELNQAGNLLSANKERMTSNSMTDIMPDVTARLIEANKAVKATESLVLDAVNELKSQQANAQTGAGRAGQLVSNLLFGSDSVKAAEGKLETAEKLRTTTVGLLDGLKESYLDTQQVVTAQTARNIDFINVNQQNMDKQAVLAGKQASTNLQLKRINSNRETATALAGLTSQQLTLKQGTINTAYKLKMDRYNNKQNQQTKALALADRQEARADRAELKQLTALNRQATYYAKRLSTGAMEYSRLTSSASELPPSLMTQELLADVTELGSKRAELDSATIELQNKYGSMGIGEGDREDLPALMEDYVKAQTAYTQVKSKVTGLLTTQKISAVKQSAQAKDVQLVKVNGIVDLMGMDKYASFEQFQALKGANPKAFAMINDFSLRLPNGADPSEAVESPEPNVFTANVEEVIAQFGVPRTSALLGDDTLKIYKAIKRNNMDVRQLNPVTGSKATQEAKLGTSAVYDSRIAQLNAFNADAPTNAFTDLYRVTPEDLALLASNEDAAVLATIIKGDVGFVTLRNLNAFIDGKVMEATSSSELADVLRSTAAMMKAVYATKPDMTSVGLGVDAEPVASVRSNSTGKAKKRDLINLTNATSLLKNYLADKDARSPDTYWGTYSGGIASTLAEAKEELDNVQ